MRGWVAGVLLGAGLLSGEDQLHRIKARMQENLARLPDHVCLQTVERWRRSGPTRPFEQMDTLRLEVGVSGNREMFAWRGSKRFADKELADLVGSGTVGNGNFALHARNVFASRAPEFTFVGEVTLGERLAIRYDFDVPLERSSYRIRVPPNQALVAFHGSFWVDAATLDLIRLEVQADDLPEKLGLAAASDTMEYARVPIGGSDFLLPRSSELTMLGMDGLESRNRTEFSGCRQFTSESRMLFEDPASAPREAPRETTASRTALAPRLWLELTLDSEIALDRAAAGDAIRAVLVRPLKNSETVVAPEGAVVHGRVVRIEKNTLPIEHYVVGLEFHSLETGDARLDFSATLEETASAAGLIRQAKRMNPTFKKGQSPRLDILVREQQRGQGVLHWDAKKPRIPRGFRMKWRTEGEREDR